MDQKDTIETFHLSVMKNNTSVFLLETLHSALMSSFARSPSNLLSQFVTSLSLVIFVFPRLTSSRLVSHFTQFTSVCQIQTFLFLYCVSGCFQKSLRVSLSLPHTLDFISSSFSSCYVRRKLKTIWIFWL